jgi:hypothetical protein
MRMIAKYETRSQAQERAAFLQAHGIATHISDMTALRMNLAHQGRFRAGLWVLFENQYQDAVGLLENPDHEVSNPLSVDQLEHLETEGQAGAQATLLKWSLVVLVGLAAAAALVVYLGP